MHFTAWHTIDFTPVDNTCNTGVNCRSYVAVVGATLFTTLAVQSVAWGVSKEFGVKNLPKLIVYNGIIHHP